MITHPHLANKELTPGSWDPTVTAEQVCTPGFTTGRRPNLYQSLKLKGQAMARYGIPLTPVNWHKFTMDHLVPIELGGDGFDVRNVWPQLKSEAKLKDVEENAQKHLVCHYKRPLITAQMYFQTWWSA